MPRPPRNSIITKGATYHLIARGNNRMRLFHHAEDYVMYLDLLLAYSKSCGVAIHHYVLMPNHVHLIVNPKGDLSIFMQTVQMTYAKRFCKRYRHVGHVWSGRYKSLPILSDAYLYACGNYIEMNPVRAKMVLKPEDWRHSSYKVYAFGKYDPLVTLDPYYPGTARIADERERRYRELVDKTRAKT